MLVHIKCKQKPRREWTKVNTFSVYQVKAKKDILLKYLKLKIWIHIVKKGKSEF